MSEYIDEWCRDLTQGNYWPLRTNGAVEGLREKELGPRSEFARIKIVFAPADHFEVVCSSPNRNELEETGFLRSAILGVLDVLFTAQIYPVRNVRLEIVDAEIDPMRSSASAFRWAGREAGKKIITELETSPTANT